MYKVGNYLQSSPLGLTPTTLIHYSAIVTQKDDIGFHVGDVVLKFHENILLIDKKTIAVYLT